MKEIIIEEYNPKWAEEFNTLKHLYLSHMKHIHVDIQHVGSTSVVGLAAKPIIDIDIIIDSKDDLPHVIDILDTCGYTHVGDLGMTGREAFTKRVPKTPEHDGETHGFLHHVYVCLKGSISLENHLRFRDFLRNHPETVVEYGQLKKELSRTYQYDIDSYIEGKTAFITSILSKTGLSPEAIDEISEQNRTREKPLHTH